MTSLEAKKMLIQAARPIDSRFRAAITEGLHHSDVLMVRWPNRIQEYEIKVSRADFMCEIKNIRYAMGIDDHNTYGEKQFKGWKSLSYVKYTKHSYYLGTSKRDDRATEFVPHAFYFAVPPELVDFAIEKVKEYKLPYGVVRLTPNIPVMRIAKTLKTNHISTEDALELFYRCFRERPLDKLEEVVTEAMELSPEPAGPIDSPDLPLWQQGAMRLS